MKETELVPLSELEADGDDESEFWEEESQNTIDRQLDWHRDKVEESATVQPWKVGMMLTLIIVSLQLFFLFSSKDNSDQSSQEGQNSEPTADPLSNQPTLSPTVISTTDSNGGRFQ
jgi:hypothetical protein